ncbi:MAG: DNA-processing protein DprA [Puniceicoccales bacterium]|jgi:DNA processing protein|nr:DNA-processing protein DprA [Puniceicoccales bacterium]
MKGLSGVQACLLLNALPKIGPVSYRKLRAHFDHDPARILEASDEVLRKVPGLSQEAREVLLHPDRYFSLQEEWGKMQAQDISFLPFEDALYPPLLREIYDPPIGLYCRGSPEIPPRCIAIVGSRQATPYGLKIAHQLARDLAQRDYGIVSGLAQGIDAAAHEGALAAGGRTVAVLGTGVDVIYPRNHRALYQKIIRTPGSCVLSEFPLAYPAEKHHFPIRNRIISGLCQAIIVVETTCHGGSMITARLAAEQGRQVFAVPGRIDQPTSQGCLALIREGATLLSGVEDIFEELPFLEAKGPEGPGAEAVPPAKPPRPDVSALLKTELERALHELIRRHDRLSLDEILQQLEHQPQQIISSLQMLELRQVLTQSPSGHYECLA